MSVDTIEENEARYREGQSKKIAKQFIGKTDLFSYEHQTTLAPASIFPFRRQEIDSSLQHWGRYL